MKSNEEFIAGIYEKAAAYTEENETKIVKVSRRNMSRPTAGYVRIAAMVVLCVGLAGVGILTLGKDSQNQTGIPEQAAENYGIALTSELGGAAAETGDGVAQFRLGPVIETVTFNGVVEHIDTEENRIWLKLLFDESAPVSTEGSIVCIRWDILEEISEEIVVGTTLTATGVLAVYENEASEYNGCAELVLTDVENFEIK